MIEKILTILGSLAGILSLFGVSISPNSTITIIFIFLMLISMTMLKARKIFSNFPPFTMIKTSVRLDLRKDYRRVSTEALHLVRPNSNHLREISFAGFSADGRMENFKWDDSLIDVRQIKNNPPGAGITIRFPAEKIFLKNFWGKLTFDYLDSFSEEDEYYGFLPSHPTNNLTIEILFPEDKLCRKARAFKVLGGTESEVEGLEMLDEGRRVTLKIKNPVFGAKYLIKWSW